MAEFNQFTCGVADAITGWSENCAANMGAIVKIFLEDPDHSFDTITDALTETTVNTAIENKQLYPLPLVQEYDDNSEDDTEYVSPINSLSTFIREGKAMYEFRLINEPCLYKRMRQFNGRQMRLIMVDNNNNVIGTTPDGTKFQGVLLNDLRIKPWRASDGSTPSWMPIKTSVESNIERNDNVAVFEVDWNIQGKNGIQPATLTEVGTSNATTIVVDVAQSCDGVAVSGLTASDFIFLESDGTTEETISGAVEDSSVAGRYTLSATAFTTGGTLNLRDVVTLGSAFYQGTAITITF